MKGTLVAKKATQKNPAMKMREALVNAKDTIETVLPSIEGRMKDLAARYEPTTVEHWKHLAQILAVSAAKIQHALQN